MIMTDGHRLGFAGVLIQYNVTDTSGTLARLLPGIQPLGDETAMLVANGAYWVHCFAVSCS